MASPDIGKTLKIRSRLISLEAMVAAIGICVASCGLLLRPLQEAPWVGVGTIVSGVAGMWTSQANSFASVGGLQTVYQASTLAIRTPFGSLLADYYPPEARGRVYALRSLEGPIIAIIAVATCGPAIDRFGWRSRSS